MEATSLLAFAGLCVLLSLTPGPDVILVIRHGARHLRSGIAVAAGSAAGSLGWALLVAIGLAALIEQSAEAYRLIRILGGCYLIYLGIQALLRSRHRPTGPATPPTLEHRRLGGPSVAGFLSCMLNPKVGLFFLAVVPQFLPAGGSVLQAVLVLGSIDAAVAMIYFTAIVVITGKIVGAMHRPEVMDWMERVSGGVLISLGVGTAVQAATAKS